MPDVQEHRALLSRTTFEALKGSAAADFGRVRDFATAFATNIKAAAKAAFDAVKFARDVDQQIETMQLRSRGRSFEADLKQIRDETADAMAAESDPLKRQKIEELGQQRRSDRAKQERQDLLQGKREFDARMIDEEADLAARKLMLDGKGDEAERLRLETQHKAKLEMIRQQADAEAAIHRENEEEIRDRAARAAGLEEDSYQTSLREMQQRDGSRFRPEMAPTYKGDSRLISGAVGLTSLYGQPDKNAEAQTKASQEVVKATNKMAETLEKVLQAIANPDVVLKVVR